MSPIFEFSCDGSKGCGSLTDDLREIARRDDPYQCPYCGELCRRHTYSATAIVRWKEQCSDGKSVTTSMGPTQGLHPAGRDQQRLRRQKKNYRQPNQFKDQWEGPQTNFNSQGYSGQMPPEMPAPSSMTRTKKVDDLG